MGIIQACFDAADEIADAGTLEILPERQITRCQSFLDVRRFNMTFGTISAPATAVAKRDLVSVGIVEAKISRLEEIIGGNHTVEAIRDECQKRADAITAEKLGVGFVTLVGRIGEVGKKMRVFC